MKKHILALLLVICMISCSFAFAGSREKPSVITTNSSGASDTINTEFDLIVSDISTTISDYYYAKDVSGSFAANAILKTDLALYLTDKVNTQHHIDNIHDLGKENYNIEVNLIDYTAKTNSNIIVFEIQALTTFSYVGRDFNTTVSDVVNVKYNTQKQKIVDMYIPLDYYDEFVRSDQSESNRSIFDAKIDISEFEFTSSIISKQEELHDDIGLQYNDYLPEESQESAVVVRFCYSI